MARIHRRTALKKNGFNDPDRHNSVVSHLEPDILNCEVKLAFGSITRKKRKRKTSGSDGVPPEYLKS